MKPTADSESKRLNVCKLQYIGPCRANVHLSPRRLLGADLTPARRLSVRDPPPSPPARLPAPSTLAYAPPWFRRRSQRKLVKSHMKKKRQKSDNSRNLPRCVVTPPESPPGTITAFLCGGRKRQMMRANKENEPKNPAARLTNSAAPKHHVWGG